MTRLIRRHLYHVAEFVVALCLIVSPFSLLWIGYGLGIPLH